MLAEIRIDEDGIEAKDPSYFMTKKLADGGIYNPHSGNLSQLSAETADDDHWEPGDGKPGVPQKNGDTPTSDAGEEEEEEDPINFMYFSEKAANSELMGLTHWMFFTDGFSVYSYGIVHGLNVAHNVLADLSGEVNSMVVDPNKGYLFLGEPTKVDRYELLVDISATVPVISVNETSKTEVYTTTNTLTSITIDAD